MDKIKNIFQKLKSAKGFYAILILAVISLGIFLRSYNFSAWLHFELDQSRDAIISIKAVEEGIGNLTLQGPRAAGSFLRLGPVFYYMEYLSAKIFGPTPAGVAVCVLILSVLTLPLFYFFARRYFNTRISIALLAVFSTSLFMVMYSRFAWNPNPIPFFMLLAAYALLRVADSEEKKKNLWMWVFSLALGIGTQLHFLVLLILPPIAMTFFLIKRPRLKPWVWASSLAIVLFLYSPLIINDIKTGGENSKEFFKAITDKSDKNDRNLLEKAIRNYSEHSLGHFLIISSQEQAELGKIETQNKLSEPLKVKCDEKCEQNWPLGIVALLFFTAGGILLLKNLFAHKSGRKKDFIIMAIIWMAVSLGVTTPLSYDIAPRFFLITAPIAFVFLGLVLEFSDKLTKGRWLSSAIFIVLIILNINSVNKRFSEMDKAAYENFEIGPDRILKERHRVTLEQQNMIADHIAGFYAKNGYPVYLQSEPFYFRSLSFLIDRKNIPQEALTIEKVYGKGNHFLVLGSSSDDEKKIGKYSQSYEISDQKRFGTLTVFRLVPKSEAITLESKPVEPKKTDCGKSSGSQKRYTWNEIFGKGECFQEIDNEEGESSE